MSILKDQFGPEYLIYVYDPLIGMEGFLVIDNTILGPGKGGIRMTPNVTLEEVFRLARTMTWKNSLAGIPFGGAKAGIIWPGGDVQLKKRYIQSFARAIKIFTPKKYIAGPDIGTGEKEMSWFVETTGNWRSATGKPANLCLPKFNRKNKKCGLPHELGSTGFGVAQATAVAADFVGLSIKKSTVAIHGFGNVGSSAYRFLTKMGSRVVALADRDGAIFSKTGFNKKSVEKLIKLRQPVSVLKGEKISSDDFWGLAVDILIPASITDSINDANKDKIKAKIIIEGANIPMSEKIEAEFYDKGILIVPDFVANAGGVFSSYAEYRGYNSKNMFDLVEKRIKKITRTVLEESSRLKKFPRAAALKMAKAKIESKSLYLRK